MTFYEAFFYWIISGAVFLITGAALLATVFYICDRANSLVGILIAASVARILVFIAPILWICYGFYLVGTLTSQT